MEILILSFNRLAWVETKPHDFVNPNKPRSAAAVKTREIYRCGLLLSAPTSIDRTQKINGVYFAKYLYFIWYLFYHEQLP